MSPVTLYSGSVGINNKVPAHRLHYDPETGVSALEDAVNVLIDRTGQIRTRRGTVLKESGSFHSLISVGSDWGLVAKNRDTDTAVYKVSVSKSGDTSLSGVRDGLEFRQKVDWSIVGNAVFYSNGYQNGMITNDGTLSVPWVESVREDNVTRGFIAPPPADHICYNAGRMYFSNTAGGKHFLNYTEFGMLGVYDPAINGEQFPDEILMIVPAADGLYIGTTQAVFFLAGLNPKEWSSRKVLDYPVIEWARCYTTIDPTNFGFEVNVPAMVIGTVNGPVLFLPSGQAVNLIDKNVKMPECHRDGALAVFDESLIIQTGE